ncbi:hypothetical protein GYMLUDRAFT_266280 [Collybiopsis luxurians FD-317 M1]|uniref:Uncharacterized protein n=1 Tax=Collybiopsis luxurians FD-317 M1 TaxID=944289 RepID=A0A0D0C4W1_9AGAR|nr:hypothetical protein GYMLUDRAFT_266280 [Collybiopsis luxurians FD-317 M1]
MTLLSSTVSKRHESALNPYATPVHLKHSKLAWDCEESIVPSSQSPELIPVCEDSDSSTEPESEPSEPQSLNPPGSGCPSLAEDEAVDSTDETLLGGSPATPVKARWDDPKLISGGTYKPRALIRRAPPGLLSPQSVTSQYRAYHSKLASRCQILELSLHTASLARKLAEKDRDFAQERCAVLETENECLRSQIDSLRKNIHAAGLNMLHLGQQ